MPSAESGDCVLIREIRLKRGMTLEELAKASGVSRVSINRYELGRRAPSVYVATKIAKALDCTLEELLADKDEKAV